MKARDLMTANVQACQPDTDLAAVTKLMWDHDCGFVPVVDQKGAVVGAITDRDICIATATRGLPPERIAASQVMSSPVHGCAPDDTVTQVLMTMKQFKVHRLPVIDDHGLLKGVVSMNDIVLATEHTKGPALKEIVSTMAAICEHRTLRSAAA